MTSRAQMSHFTGDENKVLKSTPKDPRTAPIVQT